VQAIQNVIQNRDCKVITYIPYFPSPQKAKISVVFFQLNSYNQNLKDAGQLLTKLILRLSHFFLFF